ncbi:hypothetical protein [Aliivibrio salmonicida]|nr:hypothetical protein [Aliivibrio salmonicida]
MILICFKSLNFSAMAICRTMLPTENKRIGRKMLITDPIYRAEQAIKNRNTVMIFLSHHRYSTLENIRYELGMKSKASASRILKKLCQEGHVKKEELSDNITNVTLFGVTRKGLDTYHFNLDNNKSFLKSRVSLRTLNHTLTNQKVGSLLKKSARLTDVRVINAEIGNFKQYEHIMKFKHRPDLVLVGKTKTDIVVHVIETELTLKDSKRYNPILKEYLQLRRINKISTVWYFVKNEKAKERLRQMMDKLKYKLIKHRDEREVWDHLFRIETIALLGK